MASTAAAALVERALSLLVAAEVGDADEALRTRERLTQWRSDSPAHEAAYAEALRRWQALGTLSPDLRTRFDEPPPARARRRRTIAARGALVVAAIGLGLAGLLWHLRQPTFDQLYETGAAEIATVRLPDGGRIDLNARSALRVTLYRDRRLVEFRSGDARFEVTADPRRPFHVQTREGLVEVVGTVFVVADRGGPVSIDVESGRVRFSPQTRQPHIELDGGQRVTMRHGVVGPVERVPAAREPAAWREGWLVFDNETLAEALPAINAFRDRPIRLADAEIGALRLTGRFRANDSRGLLQALPRILPVRVREQSDGSVDLHRR